MPHRLRNRKKGKRFYAQALGGGLIVASAMAVFFGTQLLGHHELHPEKGIRHEGAADLLELRPQDDHPVQRRAWLKAKDREGTRTEDLVLTNSEDRPQSLRRLQAGRPMVLVFIERSCPCCLGAKPFFDRLAKAYGDRIVVCGVINAPPPGARVWRKATGAAWPILSSPDLKAMEAHGAEAGGHVVLLSSRGAIDSSYPGVSQQMLSELNQRLASLTASPLAPISFADAPRRLTSGCVFALP